MSVLIENPLPFPVRVRIYPPGSNPDTWANVIVNGKSRLEIPVEPGEYDVDIAIIKFDDGNEVTLGEGDWVSNPTPKQEEPSPIRSLEEMLEGLKAKEVKSAEEIKS